MNAAMGALLNTKSKDDVLFVQEPWFSKIGTMHDDTEHDGRDVLGGAANSQWELLYPYFTNDCHAKVMTYVRVHDRNHPFKKNAVRAAVRNDLVSHPSLMIVDIWVGKERWRVVNFYHDVGNNDRRVGFAEPAHPRSGTAHPHTRSRRLQHTLPTLVVPWDGPQPYL